MYQGTPPDTPVTVVSATSETNPLPMNDNDPVNRSLFSSGAWFTISMFCVNSPAVTVPARLMMPKSSDQSVPASIRLAEPSAASSNAGAA